MSERPSQIHLDFLERIKEEQKDMRVGGPEGGGQKMGGAPGKGGRQGKEETNGQQDWGASASLQMPLPPLAQPLLRPGEVDVPGGRCGRLGNLSVLSEMSAEINLANPPRWPVTLISLKFQAD